MNWGKILLTGAVGGVVVWLYSFLMHGVIMDATYAANSIFRRDANMFSFLLVAACMSTALAMIFAKTRSSWAEGIKGGLTFGAFAGLVGFFAQFYAPLIFNGFPYYLAWCWGGIDLLGWTIFGAVASFIIK